ncbi:MAG: hypothetical protein ABGZ35_03470 [Planctomycetaceae bacterium]
MDALILRVLLIAITLFVSTGANFRTRNFAVTAPEADEAKTVAEAAEEYRRRLAVFWIGRPLKPWSKPCTINVRSGAYGAAGQTTFQFVGQRVMNWKMMVQGSSERILDSVLPHEVNHTIFASYFRRPLPRWADEGASTLFEHSSEQRLQLDLLENIIKSRREFIPLRKLLSMKQYPTGHRPMLILYAEGFGLVDFLMQQRGRQTYLKFLSDARDGHWEDAIRKHYNHKGVEALETDWRSWVIAGMPRYGTSPEEVLATLGTEIRDVARPRTDQQRSRTNAVRGQSPEQRLSGAPVDRSGRETKRTDRRRNQRSSDVARELAEFKRRRRSTVQAPTPSSALTLTSQRLNSDSSDLQKTAAETRPTRIPAAPFVEGTRFQPTGHLDQNSNRRQRAAESLLWKRSEETGSTPQWAEFPGQVRSF